jgi:hypothetical protein
MLLVWRKRRCEGCQRCWCDDDDGIYVTKKIYWYSDVDTIIGYWGTRLPRKYWLNARPRVDIHLCDVCMYMYIVIVTCSYIIAIVCSYIVTIIFSMSRENIKRYLQPCVRRCICIATKRWSHTFSSFPYSVSVFMIMKRGMCVCVCVWVWVCACALVCVHVSHQKVTRYFWTTVSLS